MPDAAAIVLILVVAVCAVAAAIVMASRRTSRSGQHVGGPSASLPVSPSRQSLAGGPEDEPHGVLALPTSRPNEVYLFGPPQEIDEYGTTLATAPPQLAKYATGLRAAVDGVRSYGELSGRLVLVDEKTAAALKAGRMMKGKGGETLAHVLRKDGKVSSITRLREVGGLAAGAASLTSAVSAMAMQAQLDRIERQLTVLSDGIETANKELLRQWHAQALGAQDVLREVYSTATRSGELTQSNWAQVATVGHVVRSQIHGDRDRLAHAIAALEQLAAASDVKQRMNELDSRVDTVRSAHAALSESTRSWAQFSALRLWHFTVTGDATLEAYQEELLEFIESSREQIEPLRVRASLAVERIAQYRWTSAARHPIVARRLPAASADRMARLESVVWQPLELQQAAGKLVAPSESEGATMRDLPASIESEQT